MGIDEYGEGYPLAWCLSNREDPLVLRNFFEALKTRIGTIHPKWFMSDDAEQFYSAWVGVFGGHPHKLLCAWHIDRAWREHIKQIGQKVLQVQVYHNLRLLLEEQDKSKFYYLKPELIYWRIQKHNLLPNTLLHTMCTERHSGQRATDKRRL